MSSWGWSEPAPRTLTGLLAEVIRGVSEEFRAMPENELLVLQAAVADAGGNLGVYVSRARVMQQAGISDFEEFVRIAEYLDEQGYIADGVNRYELFVLTLRGIEVGAAGGN